MSIYISKIPEDADVFVARSYRAPCAEQAFELRKKYTGCGVGLFLPAENIVTFGPMAGVFGTGDLMRFLNYMRRQYPSAAVSWERPKT